MSLLMLGNQVDNRKKKALIKEEQNLLNLLEKL